MIRIKLDETICSKNLRFPASVKSLLWKPLKHGLIYATATQNVMLINLMTLPVLTKECVFRKRGRTSCYSTTRNP